MTELIMSHLQPVATIKRVGPLSPPKSQELQSPCMAFTVAIQESLVLLKSLQVLNLNGLKHAYAILGVTD